ncbi:zinc-binding dehydrogenase [Sphingosinicellaceae bacterium]|nr:zinc-binding dehydrogenase [Sphingosinicellaceae bacterium]
MFSRIGETPMVCDLPDPVAEAGDVVVDVVAAPVLAYAHEVFSGQRPMLFTLPFVPGTGAIGRISAVGAGATDTVVGSWVYCDPTLRARDGLGLPAISLQGLTANGPAAVAVQRQYPNGSWAEKLRLPLENIVPLGDVLAGDAARWLMLGTLLVPYGGLSSVALTAGETVVINGATGSFGSAAVAVALAMGAARVVATGRNAEALDELARRHGDRVRIARMLGEEATDTATIQAAAGAPIDVVFDILPPHAQPTQVLTAVRAVRPGGRISLMGGVGMAGDGDLTLPYPWLMRNNITIRGQWMYPRAAVPRLIAMVRSSQIDLTRYHVAEFALSDVGDAIAHAATTSGPFNRTALRM